MTTITINAELFVAATHFTSNDETRYYLTGVHLDPKGYMVAMDGHKMFVAQSQHEYSEPLIIATHNRKPLPIKWSKHDALQLDLNTSTLIAPNGDRVLITVVDGAFPQWDRVVAGATGAAPDPLKQPACPTQYNPHLLLSFSKACKVLMRGTAPHIGYSANGTPAPVRFGDRDDCFGLVMPYRGPEDAITPPAWAPTK